MEKIFSACLSIFNIVFKGYLIKTFWAWFILTTFPNLPRIETVTAIGFSLFISAITPWRSASGKEFQDALNKDIKMNQYASLLNGVAHTFIGLALLLMGWLLHRYFM